MLVIVETDDLLNDTMRARYDQADKKVLVGIRETLDALGVELPDAIKRKRPGRKRGPSPSRMTIYRDARAAAQASDQ